MITLLLGPDDFSKKAYIDAQAKSYSGVEFFSDVENLPAAENLAGQDLFSKAQVFVLKGMVKYFNSKEVVKKFVNSKNFIILNEEKLDKRLADNKQLLSNTEITVKEFNLPHGLELNEWLLQRVKYYGGRISDKAVDSLASALGRDNARETKFGGKVVEVAEVYNLWQADAEVQKLLAFASGQEISQDDVRSLVSENGEVDVFDLTNAIADNQKLQALELLHKFLKSQTGSDEKGSVIQLNALLSEQFRNVAAVQDFLGRKKSDSDILQMTSWKSGRLFIMKKIALKFSQKKVLEFLNKLAALDEELKTSQTPPRVVLDLIVSQLLT